MARRILILCYSCTKQTLRIAEAMAASFADSGAIVKISEIRLIDDRYEMNFPLRPFWRKLLKPIVPQLLGCKAGIQFEEAILEQEFDLICLGSPTWWLLPAIPVTTFLKSPQARRLLDGRRFAVFAVCRKFWRLNLFEVRRLANRAGGHSVGGAGFVFQGSQMRSMLSLLSYLRNGKDSQRVLGCRIDPFGITADGLEKAKSFARNLLASFENP